MIFSNRDDRGRPPVASKCTRPDRNSVPVIHMEMTMLNLSRRAIAALVMGTVLATGGAFAADAPKQIAIDLATYNPVSIILK